MPAHFSVGYVYLLRHKKLNMVKIGQTQATTPEQRLMGYADAYKIPRGDLELIQEWRLPAPLAPMVEANAHAVLAVAQVQIAGAREFFATTEADARQAIEESIGSMWAELRAWRNGDVTSEGEPLELIDLSKDFTDENDDFGEISDIVDFCVKFVNLLLVQLSDDDNTFPRITVSEYLLLQRMFSALRICCPDYYDIGDVLAEAETMLLARWRPPRINASPTDYLEPR